MRYLNLNINLTQGNKHYCPANLIFRFEVTYKRKQVS